MNLRELYPSRFIASEDFKDKPVTLTVDHVAVEQVGHGSDKESKVIAYFKEPSKATRKPIQLVLCATNAQRIAVMFGKEADDWTGHKVTLGVEMVESFGETVPAIRVLGSPEITTPLKYTPKKGSRIKPATLVPTGKTGAAATSAPSPSATPTAAPVPDPDAITVVCESCGGPLSLTPDVTDDDIAAMSCFCGGTLVRS